MFHISEIGTGRVRKERDGYRLHIPAADSSAYHNAQISSYRQRRDIHQHPPLRMTVRARAEGEMHGTAGFGFWNHPFAPNERVYRLPRAAWFFFGSPPNNMALAHGVAGHGWKCATFDALRWSFLALTPAAPVGFLLMRFPAFYRRLWPIGQAALGVSEHALDTSLLHEDHDYGLDWLPDRVIFRIDGEIVHETDRSPGGPLGFIAWIDNQYAIVTPQGRFGFGLVTVPSDQSLVLGAVGVDQ